MTTTTDEHPASGRRAEAAEKDPVCGMRVESDEHVLEHDGTTYRFCSAGCRSKFAADPERYLDEDGAKSEDSTSVGDYAPLIVLILMTAAAAVALRVAPGAEFTWRAWMTDFMGFFLVVFAMVKLFDLSGFADGFAKYDVLAGRLRAYGLVYPFLEGALGLAYLAHLAPAWTYAATIALLGFGALGVLRSVARGEDLSCACMGNVLDVPLSTVTLIEDLGMAAMAAVMWMTL